MLLLYLLLHHVKKRQKVMLLQQLTLRLQLHQLLAVAEPAIVHAGARVLPYQAATALA